MSGEGEKKTDPGGGELPLDLPGPLLFEVFSRIPILELRRLHKQRISPKFDAAIKAVLGQIALDALSEVLDLDRKDADCEAYDLTRSKAGYLFTEGSFRLDTSYSGLDCCWRDRPLSVSPLRRRCTGWNYGSAEPCTWKEGGRKFQLGLAGVDPWQTYDSAPWPGEPGYSSDESQEQEDAPGDDIAPVQQ